MPEPTEHRLPTWLRVSATPPPADAVIVGGRSCRSRPGLLAEWTAALRPADSPGPDWAALGEMIRERACDGGLTIAVENAEHLLAAEPPAQLTEFLALLDDIASDDRATLRLVLRPRGARTDELHRRLVMALPRTGAAHGPGRTTA
ncbi:MAG TPA: barstar family protein [Micromonospora sp.]